MQFNKSPKSFEEQLDVLASRGMVIADRQSAIHYLKHLNYYRLRGYWMPLEADLQSHQFKPGTTFEDALNLYIFDRELRLLLIDAIERIEVSLRTQWAYNLAHQHGAHAYLDPALSKNRHWHESNLAALNKELERSEEVFVGHYNTAFFKIVVTVSFMRPEPVGWPISPD